MFHRNDIRLAITNAITRMAQDPHSEGKVAGVLTDLIKGEESLNRLICCAALSYSRPMGSIMDKEYYEVRDAYYNGYKTNLEDIDVDELKKFVKISSREQYDRWYTIWEGVDDATDDFIEMLEDEWKENGLDKNRDVEPEHRYMESKSYSDLVAEMIRKLLEDSEYNTILF